MWLRARTVATAFMIADLDLSVDFADGEEMLTEVSCKFTRGRRGRRTRRGRAGSHALVDRSGGGFRIVAGRQVIAEDELAAGWRAARPAVAGVHLDSAACSRQSLRGHRCGRTARSARGRGRRLRRRAGRRTRPWRRAARRSAMLVGMAADDVVFTTGSEHALDLLLGSWPGPRTLACAPGEYGPNLAMMAANGFRASAPCRSTSRAGCGSTTPPRTSNVTRRHWFT